MPDHFPRNSILTFTGLIPYLESQNYQSRLVFSGGESISYEDFIKKTKTLAKALKFTGLKSGDKVAIMLESSPLWLMMDLAIMSIGGITVPIFQNLSQETLIHELEDCKPEYLVVQNSNSVATLPSLSFSVIKTITASHDSGLSVSTTSIESLLTLGKYLPDISVSDISQLLPTSTATIIYTSGTSGTPKGVMLSHSNLISQVLSSSKLFDKVDHAGIAISFLPLEHIFQRMIAYFYILNGVSVHFINDIKLVSGAMQLVKPTIFVTVPRLLEKVLISVRDQISSLSYFKKFLTTLALNYALNHIPSGTKSILHKIYSKILYKQILNKFGGKVECVVSGGAPLQNEVYRFFINIGLPIYQGYGLTECSPVISSNCPQYSRLYTVGKPFPNVTIRLADDQELLVKGSNLMQGYYSTSPNSKSSFNSEGFFHTGDLAEVDAEGYIKIIGRKKDQFKTSNGKYINPSKIESHLNSISQIESSCVVGEGRPFVIALLFVKPQHKSDLLSLEISLRQTIDTINLKLDKHEHIHYYHLVDFSEISNPELGFITPSLKLVRHKIISHFSETIADLYKE